LAFLYFLAFLLIGAAAVLLVARFTWRRTEEEPTVLLATSAGEAQGFLWVQRLKLSGIWYDVRDVSLIPAYLTGGRPQNWQIWVRATDEEAAREALGFDVEGET
jgi:hypothetical protein